MDFLDHKGKPIPELVFARPDSCQKVSIGLREEA